MPLQDDRSMHGSGIYSTTAKVGYTCENIDEETTPQTKCDFDGYVDGKINDWNNLSITCPQCGYETDLGDYQDYFAE